MKCKVCHKDNEKCFSSVIMNKYEIDYFHCDHCDFLQTEEPYWLDEAYAQSINVSDTGYMVRNLFYSKRLTILLYFLFGKNGRYVDYAGGYGVFVRLMRDIGFEFYWDDKYTTNLFSTGFEWNGVDKVEAVTLFEAFEHFIDPIGELNKLRNISDTIIFTTDLHPDPVPKPNEWWYYGLDHGQHISFYSKKTFNEISNQLGMYYLNSGSLHILSKHQVSDWKLDSTRLVKFGLDKIICKLMESKTWSDHERMSKNVE
ncbi:class I SAM-dependent methyltransferase [Halomonas sp. Mc5H-6]|uniref:class I SAM-dependent methyltransferase n=1 Tax=Halomonas sp. Mc5H-6 TaxID=2954500 RepID=UPI002096EA89|nr:class I SAM-dependent methyltransferase [Halomonas sp. Mc5H-6]MCO7246810.1 class I SAM-dependent methyltransferase [Halomonas sp. Mc5H-6]